MLALVGPPHSPTLESSSPPASLHKAALGKQLDRVVDLGTAQALVKPTEQKRKGSTLTGLRCPCSEWNEPHAAVGKPIKDQLTTDRWRRHCERPIAPTDTFAAEKMGRWIDNDRKPLECRAVVREGLDAAIEFDWTGDVDEAEDRLFNTSRSKLEATRLQTRLSAKKANSPIGH